MNLKSDFHSAGQLLETYPEYSAYNAFLIIDDWCKKTGKDMEQLKSFVNEKKKEYDTKYDTKKEKP